VTTSDRWLQIKELFRLYEVQPPASRERWLLEQCGDDRELLLEVRDLLAAKDDGSDVLDDGAIGLLRRMSSDVPASGLVGRRFGAYRLVKLLGEGGMGSVYLAEREQEDFAQRVAFKLIRGDFVDPGMRERFMRERNILARLSHPHIAQLHDGGIADGVPFFTLEYVEGEAITRYCDDRNVGLRARIELANVKPHFPWPDISAHYLYGGDWGHVQLGGIWRMIRWDQVPTDTFDLSGHVTGWGVSLGGFWNVTSDKNNVLRWQANYGDGIQNYFNDAPVDVGVENQFINARTPITGEALPIFGAVLYLDHAWDKQFTSALGWSMVNVTNSDGQADNAFHNGQYASTNLLWTPVPNVMMGGELQYSRRANFRNDFDFNDFKLQFSFKYSFSQKFGGTQ